MDDPTTSGVTEGFGLMFYREASRAALRRVDNARWYDPSIGRFAQADSMIPEQTQGTQAWDRYAFVNNNPVRYTDPTGHELSTWTQIGFGILLVGAILAIPAAIPAVAVFLGISTGTAAIMAGIGVGAAVVGGIVAWVGANVDSNASDAENAAQSAQIATMSADATQSANKDVTRDAQISTLSAPSATPTSFQPPASTATSIPTTTPNGTVTATPNIVTPTPGMEVHIVPDTPTPCGYGTLEGIVCP